MSGDKEMEDAYRILDYLPISYKTEKDQEYINFLWDTFQTNYSTKKYQFAYLAFHMLYMSFVYFIVWRIKVYQPDDFLKALTAFKNDEEKEYLEATSPFVYHKINESIVFRFLKLIGCDKSVIGKYVKMVRDRNDIAHSNGNIFFSTEESINAKIMELLNFVNEIQLYSKNNVLKCFENFLLTNSDKNNWEYTEVEDQIREMLIHKNYFSLKDLEICIQYDVNILSTDPLFENIKELYNIIVRQYSVDI